MMVEIKGGLHTTKKGCTLPAPTNNILSTYAERHVDRVVIYVGRH